MIAHCGIHDPAAGKAPTRTRAGQQRHAETDLLEAFLRSRWQPSITVPLRDMFVVVATNAAMTSHELQAYLLRRVGAVQFSMARSLTRLNSAVLLVTSVSPRARAWAAMNRSLAPIRAPRRFRSARISA
jgi:hypothetical protein